MNFGMAVMVFASGFILAATPAAQAQENSGNFQGGSVKIGPDTASCNSARNGTIRYTSGGSPLWAYCNGTAWVPFQQSGACTAPSGCTTIGATCANGSKFAGFMVYGSTCQPLFVTSSTDSTVAWGPLADDTGADSETDGRANQQWIVTNATLSNYPAFEVCENLNRHSKTDWHLPSRLELNLLYINKGAIGITDSNSHWSSSEAPADMTPENLAWQDIFDWPETPDFEDKNVAGRVRCVRRD